MSDLPVCPCASGEPYPRCCGRFHSGEQAAPTAETLMRSRYSAFAVRDEAYLVRTWHPDTRPGRVTLDPGQEWTGLTILATSGGGLFDQHGTVEFQARYVLDGRPGRIRENSAFVRYQKVWVYFGPHLP